MSNTIELLKKQLEEVPDLRKLPNSDDAKFKVWHQVTKTIIEKRLGEKDAKEFSYIYYQPLTMYEVSAFKEKQSFDEGLNSAEAFISGLLKQVEIFGESNSNENKIENTKKTVVLNKGIHLVINNTQSNQQVVNITTTFNQVIDLISEVDKSDEEKQEAREKANELKEEVEKHNPNWEKIKSILHWLLDFSQKVFLKILPFLLEKYNK